MKRTTEFVLGLIGGIFGIISGFIAMMIGGIGGAVGANGASTVGHLGMAAILLSVLGIVGAVMMNSKAKIGAWFMVIASVGGFISVSMFYILPGILLIIAGLMGLLRRQPKVIPVIPVEQIKPVL